MKNKLPKRIDSFSETGSKIKGEQFFAEYDGWHFEGGTKRAVVNKILEYIWSKLK